MNYVASTQGDAYSYGVLVLEMFINKRPTSDSFEGCLNLQDFVCTALTDRVMEIVDPFLHQGFNVDEKYWECIVSILSIGVRCSKQLPTDRMSMREVVNDLKKIKKVFPVYKNGRFGSVYKATINDDDDEQTDVAVKVLNLNVRGACKSLASECNALRGIRHRNLLKIVSVCDGTDFQGNDFKALVYEFVANGSLENWLHSAKEGMEALPLSAIQRLNIAIDIASAVEYLHCGIESIVIHGDLKPSNILLDQGMVAKVGDFGLAKIVSKCLPSTDGSNSSAIKGTVGYIAPEYGMSYVSSTQGDVYSYTVLVLEMFTNRRPTSDAFDGCLNLQDFVSTGLTNRVMEVVDPFLHQELNVDEKYWDCVVSILSIGVRCSKQLPRDRMSIAEVVNDLKKIRNVLPAHRNDRNVSPHQH
ncbi:hypothetical protein SASPL_150257 [Salvia splendens]|uniref:non-specific serine/threonine protein kinase n=1 Tax=Salvia splendens TaxID=180675 RepID=A0A8X8W6G4_SALSN|nr:hypothetical protein SASPL_150257 [Salvia splendens]